MVVILSDTKCTVVIMKRSPKCHNCGSKMFESKKIDGRLHSFKCKVCKSTKTILREPTTKHK